MLLACRVGWLLPKLVETGRFVELRIVGASRKFHPMDGSEVVAAAMRQASQADGNFGRDDYGGLLHSATHTNTTSHQCRHTHLGHLSTVQDRE